MNTKHYDITHTVEAIEELEENDDLDKVEIYDTDCIMRGVSFEEMKERNIYPEHAEQIVVLTKNVSKNYTFKFHQSQIDDGKTFEMRPPGVNEVNAQYCTTPDELGENLKKVVDEMEKISSTMFWDIGEIEGHSIARGGHITDFEFEYDVML